MDPTRGLVQLLTELSESAVTKGLQVAAGLSAGLDGLNPTDLPTKVVGVADDVVDQGRAQTDFIVSLVRSEVEKTAGRMGFVREEELAAVRRHVAKLESALEAAGIDVTTVVVTQTPAKKAAATKSTAQKTPAKKTPATKSSATKSTAKKAPVTKTSATNKSAKETAKKSAENDIPAS
jgi:hypothetical protein